MMGDDPSRYAPGSGRRPETDPESNPPKPVIKSYEQNHWPFLLATEGKRPSIGWAFPPDRKGGPGFVVGRPSFTDVKIIQRFPLTDDGWAAAWQFFTALDGAPVEAVRAVLASRAEADAAKEELARQRARTLAFLPGVSLLGGYAEGTTLTVGSRLDLRFVDDRLMITVGGSSGALVEIPYATIEDVEIGGPGLVKSGGGFVGGGFGPAGAVEGMAIAATLNALTSRTSIKTVVRVQASGCELFFLNTQFPPDRLRIGLSRALGAIRDAAAHKSAGETPAATGTAGAAIQELAKLASLLDAGLLDRGEFDQLKSRILRGD